MSLDSYRTLGRSGLRVSPMCLGAMTFGEESGFGSNVEDSVAILNRYLEKGGNFIDTANIYTKGQSEKILGDFFSQRPGLRHRTVIATKFFCNLFPGDPNGGGAGRKAIFAQCDESLRRLQTDYIDLYWLHNWDKYTPVEETMSALDDLVTQGKVRYIGFSDTPAWKAAQAQLLSQARGWAPLIALQLEYSLLARTIEGEHVAMANELGMGITPWSPLKGGLLSGKYSRDNPMSGPRAGFVGTLSEKDYAIVDTLRAVAADVGASPASVALAWVQSQPGVSSTIIGARRIEQLEVNLQALDLRLSQSQIEALSAASTPSLNFPYDFNKYMSPSLEHAGATVNGERTQLLPFAPQNDDERF